MATTATTPVRRSVARRVVKIVSILFTLLLAAIIIFGFWFRHAAQNSLAQLDGTLTLSGLHEPVHVVRDNRAHLRVVWLHECGWGARGGAAFMPGVPGKPDVGFAGVEACGKARLNRRL